jgi:hypothetical protein
MAAIDAPGAQHLAAAIDPGRDPRRGQHERRRLVVTILEWVTAIAAGSVAVLHAVVSSRRPDTMP